MKARWIGFSLLLGSTLLPSLAQAYVGPGAGLGLLAAFWAVIVSIGMILVFIAAWPLRRLMRRRAQGNAPGAGHTDSTENQDRQA
jgi:hypothetical protein